MLQIWNCPTLPPPPTAPGKKSKIPLFRKNRLKGDIFVTTKKDDIYPTKYGISVEIPYYWHSRNSSRSSNRRCSIRKGCLGNFAKFTGKDLCQGLFLNKVTGYRLKACNFIKRKRLWRRWSPVNFTKFLLTPFLQSTFVRLLLELQWFLVLLWGPL